mgnify:CR=1 FL=1
MIIRRRQIPATWECCDSLVFRSIFPVDISLAQYIAHSGRRDCDARGPRPQPGPNFRAYRSENGVSNSLYGNWPIAYRSLNLTSFADYQNEPGCVSNSPSANPLSCVECRRHNRTGGGSASHALGRQRAPLDGALQSDSSAQYVDAGINRIDGLFCPLWQHQKTQTISHSLLMVGTDSDRIFTLLPGRIMYEVLRSGG